MLLSRYLMRQLLWPTLLLTLLFCVLVWGLQALRLGHHLVGSGIGFIGILELFALSLPGLLVFTLPLGLACALALTLVRLSPELKAMRTAGASPARLASSPLALILGVTLLVVAIASMAERPSTLALHQRLTRAAARGLLLKAEPGRFHTFGELTLLFEHGERRGDSLHVEQLFIARGDDLLLARRGTLRVVDSPPSVQLQLHDGELHLSPLGKPYQRLRFTRWSQRLDTPSEGAAHFSFVRTSGSTTQRALRFGLATLALGLMTLTCSLLLSPPRSGWVVVIAITSHEIALWTLPMILAWPGSAPVVSGIAALMALWLLRRFGS
ncbi:MAG: LptF/LptG family permease [Deltaproteobacteria bacterium]|nr:LptF/LptG family permease [Deltaproteobacteria bacterium]